MNYNRVIGNLLLLISKLNITSFLSFEKSLFRECYLLDVESNEYLWIKDNFDKTMKGHYVNSHKLDFLISR